MNIGERIRHRRIELGLTQTEFAKKMGLSAKSTVSKLENQGDNLTTNRIRRIAEVLECTPAYLMGWEDEEGLNTDMAQTDDMDLGVGTKIRNKRIELELTQEELAKRMGYMSKAAICKVERGDDNITVDRIRAFAKALECTPAYLIGWEDEIEIETNNIEHSEIIKKYIKLLSENTEMAPYIDKLRQLPPEYRNIVYTSINSVYEAYILTKEKEHEENNG